MSVNRRGFTLIELLVALVLTGIVSAAIYQLLVNNQRVYREQTQRIELADNLRSAMAILPAELRELSTSDPAGSDIISMNDSTLRYKAMRSFYTTCSALAVGSTISLSPIMIGGLRALDPSRDSILIFADGNSTDARDDRWIRADVVAVGSGTNCAGGPSVEVTLGGVILGVADSVVQGSPVRGFEVVEFLVYQDAYGSRWLGVRPYSKAGTPSAPQPLLGPLEPGGLRFTYYDAAGMQTADPAQVLRIAIRVIGRTQQPVRRANRQMGYVIDTLSTQVMLRNSR